MRDLNIHIVCSLESALPRLVWEYLISIYHNLNSKKGLDAVKNINNNRIQCLRRLSVMQVKVI